MTATTEEIQDSFSWLCDQHVQCDKCPAVFRPDDGFSPLEEHYESHKKDENGLKFLNDMGFKQ